MSKAVFGLIVGSAVQVTAPYHKATVPKLTARTIIALESNIRRSAPLEYDSAKYVRVYTVQMREKRYIG